MLCLTITFYNLYFYEKLSKAVITKSRIFAWTKNILVLAATDTESIKRSLLYKNRIKKGYRMNLLKTINVVFDETGLPSGKKSKNNQ